MPIITYVAGQTGFNSYEEQNLYETTGLLSMVSAEDESIIMGDFNFSPEILDDGISPRFPESYASTEAAGFYSVNAALQECTVCGNNSLSNPLLVRDGDNYILDHILLRNTSRNNVDNVEVRFPNIPIQNVSQAISNILTENFWRQNPHSMILIALVDSNTNL